MIPEALVRLHDLDALERFEHEAMATRFTLHLASPNAETKLQPIAEEAFRLLDRLEDQLSFYREGSDVTRINRAVEGEVVRIDDVTHHCLLTAIQVSAASSAVFDPFAGHAAIQAKNQSVPHHLGDVPPPEPNETEPVLALDPEQPQITKLNGKRWLDLGAIGKGAALDAMAQLLQEWDVSTAVLNGGGSSILIYGAPPVGTESHWCVSLLQVAGQPQLKLAPPFAFGASGEGFQPGHVIGAAARPQSLVLAPAAAEADALSTAALLMSDEKLHDLLDKEPGYGVLATRHGESPTLSGVFSRELKMPAPNVTLVIPCWCESERLTPFLVPLARRINERQLPVEIIVVDDGSPGEESTKLAQQVEKIHRQYPQVKPLEAMRPHRGKGGAIYHGWRKSHAEAQWLGFVDADGAVPVEAVITGIEQAFSAKPPYPLIAANRYHRDRNNHVHRSWIRQRTGSWFANWARTQLQLDTVDSQCGFKLLPAQWWREYPDDWQEQGYAFDLELLLAAQAAKIPTLNLNISWREVGGSNVGMNDGFKLVQAVKRLRRKRGR
ncbi:MAG: glycosyltransferase [Opitutaceae bacterium]|nr:glycosyltransferase [Opitutaceae bacterium]